MDHVCPICLDALKNQKTVKFSGCRHRFCTGCLDHWLKKSASCPVCRKLFGLRIIRRPAVRYKHIRCWDLECVNKLWDKWRLCEKAQESENVVSIIIDVLDNRLVLGFWDKTGAPLIEKQVLPLRHMAWCVVHKNCLGVCIKMGELSNDHLLIVVYCKDYDLENILDTGLRNHVFFETSH